MSVGTRRGRTWFGLLLIAAGVGAFAGSGRLSGSAAAKDASYAGMIPKFEPDPYWPKQLPNNWILGNISGAYVDKQDRVWVLHRGNTGVADLADDYAVRGAGECCQPAPSVVVFDQAGNVVKAWGGQNLHVVKVDYEKIGQPPAITGIGLHEEHQTADGYTWPREHGLFVDYNGDVWTGSDMGGYTLTKFTNDGKVIWQKGTGKQSKGNADLETFSGPSGIFVDEATKEAFVADGYVNKRVAVVDVATGAIKRMWGPYGIPNPPDVSRATLKPYDPDAPPSKLWGDTLHCLKISRDGLVYVCDRANDRIQVFKKDGTFVKEGFVKKRTKMLGSTFDVAFSPDKEQKFMYVADGSNHQVHILIRDTLEHVGSFSHGGRAAGELGTAHVMTTDSKGNVYVGETVNRNRIQRFKYAGMTKRVP